MGLNASDLRTLYTALQGHGSSVSAETLAQATGFSASQVKAGLEILIKAGLAKNSQACVEETRFKTR